MPCYPVLVAQVGLTQIRRAIGRDHVGPPVQEPELPECNIRTMRDPASPIALGLWPIAGITTIGVTQQDARSTIATAIECGITTFDSAFSYGYEGESDRLIGEFLNSDRERFTIIGKVGQRWRGPGDRVIDGRPETLKRDAELSLDRMRMDSIDLLMLHCPDPEVPLAESAAMLCELRDAGLCRQLGICNVDINQLREFSDALDRANVHCSAIQCPLNILQQDRLQDLIPASATGGCDVQVYWTLMKGLLAGRISRNHVFQEGDSRPKYEVFQGEQRERAHRLIDGLRTLGDANGRSVGELAIGWALSQPGVTTALVGARRPEQIRELASASALSSDLVDEMNRIVEETSGIPE